MTYHAYTDYWGENKTLATELWDALDIDQVTISVSNSWADTKGLPVTERFPWDHDRGLFYLKGIHDLHCVVSTNLTRKTQRVADEQEENASTGNQQL